MTDFKAGQTLLKEGAVADQVGIIRRGEVDICKQNGGVLVRIGRVGIGDFLGDMAVLESRKHGASAVAASDGEIEWVSAAGFLRWVSEEKEVAYRLLVRMSHRLSSLNATFARRGALPEPSLRAATTEKEAASDGRTVTLEPARHSLAETMENRKVTIKSFPYFIGRHAGLGEHAADHRMDLLLEDAEPFRLSREHFAIIETEDGLAIQDLHSHLGTVVNGVGIGSHCAADIAPLETGPNRVIAGGEGSGFEFELTVDA